MKSGQQNYTDCEHKVLRVDWKPWHVLPQPDTSDLTRTRLRNRSQLEPALIVSTTEKTIPSAKILIRTLSTWARSKTKPYLLARQSLHILDENGHTEKDVATTVFSTSSFLACSAWSETEWHWVVTTHTALKKHFQNVSHSSSHNKTPTVTVKLLESAPYNIKTSNITFWEIVTTNESPFESSRLFFRFSITMDKLQVKLFFKTRLDNQQQNKKKC